MHQLELRVTRFDLRQTHECHEVPDPDPLLLLRDCRDSMISVESRSPIPGKFEVWSVCACAVYHLC
jgi:hypothetical protein